MIEFLIGAILGSIITLVTMSCCIVAKEADEQMKKWYEEDGKK